MSHSVMLTNMLGAATVEEIHASGMPMPSITEALAMLAARPITVAPAVTVAPKAIVSQDIDLEPVEIRKPPKSLKALLGTTQVVASNDVAESALSKLCTQLGSAPDPKITLRDIKDMSRPLPRGRSYGGNGGGASGEFKGSLYSRRYWWGTSIAEEIISKERTWDLRGKMVVSL